VIRWRWAILAVIVLIAAGFGLALRHVQYQTNYLAYYRKSEKLIQDSRALVQRFGGFTNIFLTLEAPGGEANYFLRPEVLAGWPASRRPWRRSPTCLRAVLPPCCGS
jgi:predicted RND superfamily exporter protein